MPLPALTPASIVIGATAVDWRDAVRISGAALTAVGSAKPGYALEMIRMIENHGPYVVIAPGLALAHARPGPEVLADGLAIVTLKNPVPFGHPHNDPVRVVLALAITSIEGHLESIAELANIFNDEKTIPALAAAVDADAVLAIMTALA
ncbi:MAG: PTS sugar transporter subunit IIA [Microbacteriaceae bacterium]|nr:PTS sugar transporter subunit IIA [Microbacteriaceae bacterium]